MNKTQIIKYLLPGALLSYEKYNILPSLTIAQAILETGWLQPIKGNNIFGIKWTTGCAMDGIYGHETARLVKAYQKNNKLAADGIVGKDTWHRLLS